MKLDVKAFGIACGIVWAVCVFFLGLLSMAIDWGTAWVTLISSMYIGYKATALGSLIGALWAFADAGIGGVAVAWLYNKLSK